MSPVRFSPSVTAPSRGRSSRARSAARCGAEEDHLQDVKADQHDHRLAGIIVDRAEQPAAEYVVLQIVNAFPRAFAPGL